MDDKTWNNNFTNTTTTWSAAKSTAIEVLYCMYANNITLENTGNSCQVNFFLTDSSISDEYHYGIIDTTFP